MASDLIYREDAKDFVRYACHKGLNPVKYLDEVPAADVAPVKRGKWVFKHHKMMGKTPCCTECGKFEPMIRNFCPNCGADMRGSNLDTTKEDSKDGKG